MPRRCSSGDSARNRAVCGALNASLGSDFLSQIQIATRGGSWVTSPEHDVFLVPSQYSSIQEAIGAIVRPSTIMVSPGVYREDLHIVGKPGVVISTIRFGRRGVTLVGATAEAVVHVENSS